MRCAEYTSNAKYQTMIIADITWYHKY